MLFSVCTHVPYILTYTQIGGEYQTSDSPEAQFKRNVAEELRGLAPSLVEQLVYEGPQLIPRDELLMELRNTGVHSVSECGG